MTNLLTISQPNETPQVFCVIYQQATDLIEYYNSLSALNNKAVPDLPEWALNAIFEHFNNTDTPVITMANKQNFLCQFMITHRGAALDCFFDNIIATDSKSFQYLIYRPHSSVVPTTDSTAHCK